MKNLSEKVSKEIQSFIGNVEFSASYKNVGYIEKVNDGVVSIGGLSQAMMGEILNFPNNITGIVLNLMEGEVGAIVLGDHSKLSEGDEVSKTGNISSVKAGYELLGRVINPLAQAVDSGKTINWKKTVKRMLLEKVAPGIVKREPVNTPLQTGIKAIDAMIPIGRGQRELIIGDRNTGKTAIAIDTIINQSIENKKKTNKRVISIYVAIGQKQSKVAQTVEKLDSVGAMEECIVVVGAASDPVAMQYLAPYSACAIAEFFMQQGEDVLIVYDDLTKHAWAYRQISLILKRPSGREAYPGDIFYLHSRLLERACKVTSKEGGGSITALPIIETQAQDISSYIPTNVISITDGQIYLEPDLFYQGIRPAVNIGLSVSRVGGAAQLKSVKKISGRLRLDLAQYNELSAFAQFGSDLDEISRSKIERGKRVIQILKQPQYQPISVGKQLIVIWYVTKGYLDETPVEECLQKADEFAETLLLKLPKLSKEIFSKDGISKESEDAMLKIADLFSG
jgi:F-type H+-transporting ATPase subunit alpha